MGDAVGSLNQR